MDIFFKSQLLYIQIDCCAKTRERVHSRMRLQSGSPRYLLCLSPLLPLLSSLTFRINSQAKCCTVHCTLYTVSCILHLTVNYLNALQCCALNSYQLCTVHSVQCILYSNTVKCTLNSVQCTLYTLRFKLNSVHCTLYTLEFNLNSVHYTQYTAQCTLNSVPSTQYTAQCTLYSVYCIVNTTHCPLYTEHCTLNTTQCTVHTWSAWPVQ